MKDSYVARLVADLDISMVSILVNDINADLDVTYNYTIVAKI